MRDALIDAIRRSVEARNKDPQRMRRWVEDFSERMEGENGNTEDPVQG